MPFPTEQLKQPKISHRVPSDPKGADKQGCHEKEILSEPLLEPFF